VRKSYLEPRSIIDTIAKTVERHVANAKELFERQDALRKERTELDRYAIFLGTLLRSLSTRETRTSISSDSPYGSRKWSSICGGHLPDHRLEIELMTEIAEDGTRWAHNRGKGPSDKVKKSLSDEHVPSLSSRIVQRPLILREGCLCQETDCRGIRGVESINTQRTRFAQRWILIYQTVRSGSMTGCRCSRRHRLRSRRDCAFLSTDGCLPGMWIS
jgi:hypothetical protein